MSLIFIGQIIIRNQHQMTNLCATNYTLKPNKVVLGKNKKNYT